MKTLVIAVLTALLVPAGVAGAQDAAGPPPATGQGGERGGEGPTLAAIEREFDRLEMVEAQRALGMDDASFRIVAVRLQRLQAVRRRHMMQRRQVVAELRAALESGAVDANADGMAARLVEIGQLGVRHAQELRRAGLALDAALTVRQRVQYRLFQERFERRKLDLLARARAGRGAPPVRPR